MISQEQHRRNTRLAPHMMYICPECGKGFRAQPDWRTHLNIKHNYQNKTIKDLDFKEISDQYHECQLCFKWVANAKHTIALLQYHRFMHLPFSQTYRCLHCRSSFSRRRALNDHLEVYHMREIELYEKKISDSTKVNADTSSKPQGQQGDLIKKALLNSDIDLEAENQIEKNPNELALDRSLSAFEELVRLDMAKEKKSQIVNIPIDYEKELDKICEELIPDNCLESNESGKEKSERSARTNDIKCEKVVSIEIDALREDEVEMLKQEISKESAERDSPKSPPRKRKCKSIISSGNNSFNGMDSEQEVTKYITYLCPQCGQEFSNLEKWKEHVFSTHDFYELISKKFLLLNDNRSFKCLVCLEVQYTNKRSELQRHYFQHLPYRAYLKCKLCDCTKTSTSKIDSHIKHNHADELPLKQYVETNPKCKYCEKIINVPGKYERHMMICKKRPTKPVKKIIDAYNVNDNIGYLALIDHFKHSGKRLHNILAASNGKN